MFACLQAEVGLADSKQRGRYTTKHALDVLQPFVLDFGVGGADSAPSSVVLQLTNPGVPLASSSLDLRCCYCTSVYDCPCVHTICTCKMQVQLGGDANLLYEHVCDTIELPAEVEGAESEWCKSAVCMYA